MAGAKEIRTKIKSIASTRKITRAMEMVAASKMRKAQERMKAALPYAQQVENVIAHFATADPDYIHPYMQKKPVHSEGIIVVSSDRGLCGGLNVNLFRKVLTILEENEKAGIKTILCLFGAKAEAFFKSKRVKILASAIRMGDTPTAQEIIGPVDVMVRAFNEGTIDRLRIVYNHFVNTMSQVPTVQSLIPAQPAVAGNPKSKQSWDYIYEPDSKTLLDQLLYRYIETMVYKGIVENFACEQAARMVAMKSASENAAEIIYGLKLAYNKARQATITKELSEIVSGAEAV